MGREGVKLFSEKLFMGREEVKLFSEKLFMGHAGVFQFMDENVYPIFFCTIDGFFRILEKTSSELICTRLYFAGLAKIGCGVPETYSLHWLRCGKLFLFLPPFSRSSWFFISFIDIREKKRCTLQNFLFQKFIRHNRIRIHLFPKRNSCHNS